MYEDLWDEKSEREIAEGKVLVEADEMKFSENGVLTTGELTTCIGLGVYSPSNNKGYMIHLDPGSEPVEEYMEELEIFKFGLKQDGVSWSADDVFDKAKVFLGGSCLPPNDSGYGRAEAEAREKIHGTRGMIKDEFVYPNFEIVNHCFGAKDGYHSCLSLNVDKAEFNYDQSYASSDGNL